MCGPVIHVRTTVPVRLAVELSLPSIMYYSKVHQFIDLDDCENP